MKGTIKPEEAEKMIGKAVSVFRSDYRTTRPSAIGIVVDIVKNPLKREIELIIKKGFGFEQLPLEQLKHFDLDFWTDSWRSDVLPSILNINKEEDFYKTVYKNVDRSVKPTRYLEEEKMIGKPVNVKSERYGSGMGIVVDIFGWCNDYMVEYDFPLKDEPGLAILRGDVIYPFKLYEVENFDLKREKEMLQEFLSSTI